MTVGYMREASTAGVFTFLSLLFKWKGSVWKSIWHELLIWLWLYFSISIFYRFYLRDTPHGEVFEQMVMFSDTYIKTAASSLTFVLGFYVTHVATRWWNIFMTLPWPDSPCLAIAAMLKSKGEKHKAEERRLRRTIVRYLTLSFVLVLRDISERIRRRFPDLKYLIPALLTDEERQRILKAGEKELGRACIFWLPIEWILMILKRCYEEKMLDETHFMYINRHILNYRNNLNNLLSYDWICTPLVYTQVVNLSTTFYFVMCLLAKQYIGNEKSPEQIWQCDYVIPIFTIFEFIFYVGWLKVAQVMLNPFGMDDDDFEVDFLIERNLKIGYCMIDEVYDDPPKLVDINFEVLPHTKASAKVLKNMNPMEGSVASMRIDRRDAQVIPAELLKRHHVIPTSLQLPPSTHSFLDMKSLTSEVLVNTGDLRDLEQTTQALESPSREKIEEPKPESKEIVKEKEKENPSTMGAAAEREVNQKPEKLKSKTATASATLSKKRPVGDKKDSRRGSTSKYSKYREYTAQGTEDKESCKTKDKLPAAVASTHKTPTVGRVTEKSRRMEEKNVEKEKEAADKAAEKNADIIVVDRTQGEDSAKPRPPRRVGSATKQDPQQSSVQGNSVFSSISRADKAPFLKTCSRSRTTDTQEDDK